MYNTAVAMDAPGVVPGARYKRTTRYRYCCMFRKQCLVATIYITPCTRFRLAEIQPRSDARVCAAQVFMRLALIAHASQRFSKILLLLEDFFAVS